EATLRYVLNNLGLPYTNVIYSGGGHFYLLAPLSAQEKLTRIQAEIGNLLLKQHGTHLYIALGQAAIPAKGFQAGNLQMYWQEMHNQLTIAKNRRYVELGDSMYQQVFTPPEFGGNPNDTCSVCGDDQRGAQNWDEWEAQSKICPLCRSFAETIGKSLPEARFLVLKWLNPQTHGQKANTAYDILKTLGMEVQFIKNDKDKPINELNEKLAIWALDDFSQEKVPTFSQPVPIWMRYTANRVPIVRDEAEADKINRRIKNQNTFDKAKVHQPKTFTHLNVLTKSGFERLGVLRMDVDNLGDVFSKGLGESFSLSRMATLSFQISLFFEGWLKRIVENKDWENLVYTVYSGGDDLFLIAPWDQIPPLAQKIAEDFSKYTSHPGLHISGGMAFIDGKYPIYQAAEDAAEAISLAKDSGKNAFSFLNRAWKWKEFKELQEREQLLEDLITGLSTNENKGPKSILQTLRALSEMEEEELKKKGRPVWGKWMWLGAYQLARMEERYKDKPIIKEKITHIREKLGTFQNLTAWGIAARWAQLETRNPRNE
ncbi:MAG: type III-A CRISPR-associated protein Cas10/Csm1, partial [Anaerolineales bacterium]